LDLDTSPQYIKCGSATRYPLKGYLADKVIPDAEPRIRIPDGVPVLVHPDGAEGEDGGEEDGHEPHRPHRVVKVQNLAGQKTLRQGHMYRKQTSNHWTNCRRISFISFQVIR